MYKLGLGISKNFKEAFNLFQLSSELKNSNGLNNLGEMYFEGNYIERDLNKAFELFKLSSELFNDKAYYNLGNLYKLGINIQQNYEISFNYFLESSKKNNFKAQNMLGYYYEHGIFVIQDYKKAIEYYNLSSNLNYDIAQFNLGKLYLKGKGIEKNINESILLFEKSVKQGNKYSLMYLNKLSKKKYLQATNILGNIYENGIGVKKNINRAIYYYSFASDLGNDNSKHSLSMIFLKNNNFKNIEKGFELLKSSAKHGNMKSQIELSLIYKNGFENKFINKELSKKWSLLASKQGDLDSNDRYATNLFEEQKFEKSLPY